MIWDKPWIYGPLFHLFHQRQTLWLPLLAQGLMLSHLLWLAARALGTATPARHLLLAAALALLTSAPWVAALLMPDILTPSALLALFLLGFARPALSRGEALYLLLLATLAIAAHLSNLPLAAALAALTLLLRRRFRPTLRVAAPLLAACALLLLTNAIGHGRLSLSPYGSTFLLARLVANGPAARTIAAECPERGWYLCAWAGRLPTDSDVFLWEPDSPVNRDAEGHPRFLGGTLLAPEAREIIAAALRREPLAVLRDALRDTARQLVTNGIGDTLPRGAAGDGLALRIASGFPPAEFRRFGDSAQMRGLLPQRAAPFLPLQAPVLLLAALAMPLLLWRWRHDPRRRALALCVLLGLAANAFATGALSKPHQRYGARIAWLLPAAALLLAQPRRELEREAAPPR
ncbi:hypothetical protein MVG78_18505 [Roseomonas gilardii subsp. gilardii]|uniref:hypothetical protein n=1 Tax=Roseomonas gilardii TaxID=257708 RepID=UPI001FFAD24B|nr:hypothetical protein [Roseomonas gilardii]UPG72449.1 hypothetical protein MVG78_18505 [Roseomonas gilardii subsp. gilardii]